MTYFRKFEKFPRRERKLALLCNAGTNASCRGLSRTQLSLWINTSTKNVASLLGNAVLLQRRLASCSLQIACRRSTLPSGHHFRLCIDTGYLNFPNESPSTVETASNWTPQWFLAFTLDVLLRAGLSEERKYFTPVTAAIQTRELISGFIALRWLLTQRLNFTIPPVCWATS